MIKHGSEFYRSTLCPGKERKRDDAPGNAHKKNVVMVSDDAIELQETCNQTEDDAHDEV